MKTLIQILMPIALLLFAAGSVGASAQKSGRSAASLKESMLASVNIDDLISTKKSDAKSRPSGEPQLAANQDELEQPVVPTVEAEVFMLDESVLLAELKYQVAQHYGITDDFRLSIDKPWNSIKLKNPAWHIVVTAFPAQGLRSQFFISFELWLGNKRHSNWQLGVRCELWVDALVAKQRIDRNAQLSSSLVEVRPVDSLSLYQSPIDLSTNLNDYVAANGIKTGAPLYWRDLKERPLIKKNSIIEVVAEEGLMKISLKAKALENGVKGQLIRVRNLQSHNDIQAEVIGFNQAKVYF